MATKDDDLLGGSDGDLLSDGKGKGKTAAKKAPAKPAAKAAKPAAKEAAKPAAKAPAKPAAKAAKPAAKKAEPSGERSARGEGKFYMDPDEKANLAKEIAKNKKPISTVELAEKHDVETWKVRRAINEILVKEGKGSVEKVGNSLVYTPK